jgi:flagellar basal-body rod protein FlgF
MAGGDLSVSLSAQLALQKRLDTIANNVANVNTPGFRPEEVKFESILADVGPKNAAFVSAGETYLSRQPAEINLTGNPLDVAIGGQAWFSLDTPAGTVYTRDGRLHLDTSGQLKSVRGYSILDPGGGPITLDPKAGPVVIAQDGGIIQGGKRIAAIGLFTLPKTATLTRYDNSSVKSSQAGEAVEDLTGNSVRQGYVEGSGVSPVLEMTRLIEVSRAFDNLAASQQTSDSRSDDAIHTLAPG